MSSLYQIVMAHHQQAGIMASRTFRQRPPWDERGRYPDDMAEIKRQGRKFTTRVEKRLRGLETNG